MDIWPVRIAAQDTLVAQLETTLAPEETARAAAFRFEHLRRSFVITHGALRVLLAGYLDIAPCDIQFRYGSKGKPALDQPSTLNFNASHSDTLALFVFASGCEIGIDVERMRPLADLEAIARRFFCVEEAAELMSLRQDQRERAFFLCWTRKEAYIKAVGDGLSAPLDAFHVTLRPDEPARFLHIEHDPDAAEAWALHNLELDPAYAAALCYRGGRRKIRMHPLMEPRDFFKSR